MFFSGEDIEMCSEAGAGQISIPVRCGLMNGVQVGVESYLKGHRCVEDIRITQEVVSRVRMHEGSQDHSNGEYAWRKPGQRKRPRHSTAYSLYALSMDSAEARTAQAPPPFNPLPLSLQGEASGYCSMVIWIKGL